MILELGAGHRYETTHRAVVIGVVAAPRAPGAGPRDAVPPDAVPPDGVAEHPPPAVVASAERLLAEGADAIEIAGPGPGRVGEPPSPRAVARLQEAVAVVRGRLGVPVAVTSADPVVWLAAAAAGATVAVLPVGSAPSQADPGAPSRVERWVATWVEALSLCAQGGAAVVLAHHGSAWPGEVRAELGRAAAAAGDRGVARHRVLLDDGLGHGKSGPQCLALLRSADGLAALGHPASMAVDARLLPPVPGKPGFHDERAAHVLGLAKGCRVLRTADPRAARRSAHIVAALLEERATGRPRATHGTVAL